MSAKKLTGLMLMFLVAGGMIFAEAPKADKPDTKAAEKIQEVQRPQLPPMRNRAMADREQMYKERIVKQNEAHKASLKELEDIKKIAEEEGATKTAEAIQKLIEKKDAEFKKNMEQFERARKERAAQIREKVKKETPEELKLEKKEPAPKPADQTTEK